MCLSVKNQFYERAECQKQLNAFSSVSPGKVFKANLQERKCFIFYIILFKVFHLREMHTELITMDLSVIGYYGSYRD